jgi:hypothetical protein
MEPRKMKRARWLVLGTLMAVIAAWGSVSVVGAAASSIKTCTKVSTGKIKVIGSDAASVAKCTAKGKGVARTWDDHAVVGPLQAKATNACNEADAEADYLLANDIATAVGIGAYLDNHPSAGAAQSALCGAVPSSIKTCTKVSTNKTKVIDASAVAKCIAKGKGVAQTFDDHAVAGSLPARVTNVCNETNAEVLYLGVNDFATLQGIADYLVSHQSAIDALVAMCGPHSVDFLGG